MIRTKPSLLLGVFVITLSACGVNRNSDDQINNNNKSNYSNNHVHTFDDEWSSDDEYHWHAASCEHIDEVKDKQKHSYGDWVIETPATEETTGMRYKVCGVCNYVLNEVIDKLTHVHTYSSDWSFDETDHWHESTCGHNVFSDKEAHTLATQTIEPTYEKEGCVLHFCQKCAYEYKTDIVDKLQHHYSETLSFNEEGHFYSCVDEGYEDLTIGFENHDFEIEDIPATFRERGYTRHTCSKCGYVFNDNYTDKKIEKDTPTLSSDGKTITYGFSPKTIVSNSSLISNLERVASSDSAEWISYNGQYYIKKKAVRNINIAYTDELNLPFAIEKDAYYWFMVEPLKWRVLKKNNDHDYLVLCKDILGYLGMGNTCYGYQTPAAREDGTYPASNEYEYSALRNNIQKVYDSIFRFGDSHIKLSEIENAPYNKTKDYVFAPSVDDLTNTSYGFKSSLASTDPLRTMYVSNYWQCTTHVICNNAITHFNSNFPDNTTWVWTRTAASDNKDNAYRINQGGAIESVAYTASGSILLEMVVSL